MCIQAKGRAVLELNAKRTGWLCRTLRIKRNFLHVLSLSSPGSIFLGYFHNIVFERGSHKNVEDGVEAAVKECNALGDLDGHVHAFAHVTAGDQGVDGVYGLAELDNVIRQLSDDENDNHCEQNFEGPRFFNIWHLDECPCCDKVAYPHNQKGDYKSDADFQYLNRCFHGCA
jgi:hypothetical protein